MTSRREKSQIKKGQPPAWDDCLNTTSKFYCVESGRLFMRRLSEVSPHCEDVGQGVDATIRSVEVLILDTCLNLGVVIAEVVVEAGVDIYVRIKKK